MDASFARFRIATALAIDEQVAVEAAELDRIERILEERERALDARERDIASREGGDVSAATPVKKGGLFGAKPAAAPSPAPAPVPAQAPAPVPSTPPSAEKKASLFGGGSKPAGGLFGGAAAAPTSQPPASPGVAAGGGIDGSDPGSASQLKSQFEKRTSNTVTPRGSVQGPTPRGSVISPRPSVVAGEEPAIDDSNPGSASQLRAAFDKKPDAEVVQRKSWAAKTTHVALPDGSGTKKVHASGAVGGAYVSKTAFNKPPPEKKNFADLP